VAIVNQGPGKTSTTKSVSRFCKIFRTIQVSIALNTPNRRWHPAISHPGGQTRSGHHTINGLAQPFDLVSSPHIRVGRTPEFHKPGSDKEFGALQPSPDCTNPYPTSILRETRAIFPAFSDTPYTSAVSVACPASGSAHHYPSAPEIVKDRITGSLCVKETSVQPPPNAFPAPQLTLCRRKAQSFFRRKKACYQRIGSEHSLYR
jgi:hypothetical protein